MAKAKLGAGLKKVAAAKRRVNGASQFEALSSGVDKLDDTFTEIASFLDRKIKPDVVFPQGLLRAGFLLKKLEDLVAKAKKRFNAAALAHHMAGGDFQPGKVAVTFNPTTRVNPRWKDEAFRFGEALAGERGETWSRERFEETVKGRDDAKTSTSVKLVESA